MDYNINLDDEDVVDRSDLRDCNTLYVVRVLVLVVLDFVLDILVLDTVGVNLTLFLMFLMFLVLLVFLMITYLLSCIGCDLCACCVVCLF